MKCIRCSRNFSGSKILDNGLCSQCQFIEEKKRIQNQYRVRKSRLKKQIEDQDPQSTSFPINLNELGDKPHEYLRELELEKGISLEDLRRQHEQPKVVIETETQRKQFEEYEQWLKTHNGDHRLWCNIHGFEPDSLKGEYVTWDLEKGRLVHDESVCQDCGKRHEWCRCKEQKGRFTIW